MSDGLTLFTIPKPFSGHTGVIQRNAVASWTRLRSDWEVLLLGTDEGTAEAARDLGVRHLGEVATTAHGAPRLDDLFAKAQSQARHQLLCYVNADIILTGGMVPAVAALARERRRFLAVGRRWNLDVAEPLVFEDGWDRRLIARAAKEGALACDDAIDYFLYRPEVFGEIPPFALGRTLWDNWLAYRARSRGAILVDLTTSVVAVHQNHDYGHLAGGHSEAWKGPDTEHNRRLAASATRLFTIADATHTLRGGRVRRALDRAHLRRRVDAAAALYGALRPLLRAVLRVADGTHALRSKLGLALNPRSRHGV